jgi:hypothetical protein
MAWRALLGVAVLAAGLVGLLWAVQRQLIYCPDRAPAPSAAPVLPGARYVTLHTADGPVLGA